MAPTLTLGILASGVAGASRRLFTWGLNFAGSLGNGTTTPDVLTPTQIGSDTDWDEISAGNGHTLAIRGGKLYAWGWNVSGAVGDGTNTDRTSPVQIGSDTDWAKVSANSATHSLALKTNGKLYAWGSNGSGELGDGTTTSRNSPVQIGSDTDWASISNGASSSYALKTNGKLYAWGSASSGRLGNGTTSPNVTSPTQIGSDTDWATVAGGGGCAHAIKTNGKLYAWGAAIQGRLGNGTTTPDVLTPTQIGSDTDWAKLSGGLQHRLAIKTNGSLYGWSANSSGQLGDGTTTQRESPVQIGSDTDWDQVAAGGGFTLGRKTNNKLYSWGSAANGRLGNGTTSPNVTSPTQVGSDADWIRVAAGSGHGVGVR